MFDHCCGHAPLAATALTSRADLANATCAMATYFCNQAMGKKHTHDFRMPQAQNCDKTRH